MSIDIPKLIAFYLPQYHPVPENDEWWGKGFTEWRNVASAKPLFPGHYQPHLPADLGFYDLRLPEVREAQAALAREYGLYGFCYYHYWFTGRRILERPLAEVLAQGRPRFPFCICWANENWTRAWDGGERHILLAQNYSDQDDAAHIQALIPLLRDERYIRINGRPLLLVYRSENLPDPRRTAEIWREAAMKAGVGELYLVRVESFTEHLDPASIGFDATVEFAPDWRQMGARMRASRLHAKLARIGLANPAYLENHVSEYADLVARMLAKPQPAFRRFRCVSPGFDNSPRRRRRAAIFVGNTPERYREWLFHVLSETRSRLPEGERVVFINAWNEWGEGNHLEPDQRWGHAFLKATRDALTPFVRASEQESGGGGSALLSTSVAHGG